MTRSIVTISSLFVFLTLVASGCVTRKEYDALASELDKTRDELTQSQADAQDLSVALREAEIALDNYAARIAELEDDLELAELRATDAETELAAVLKDSMQLAASVEEMQQALAELKRLRAKAEVRAAMYRSVLNKFKHMIDNGQLEAKIVDGRMVLQLQTDILFPSGSARLSNEGAATIRTVGELLAEIPERRFQVEGHTDNVPINTQLYPSNWQLAAARAINVTTEMIEAGLADTRVSAAAFADTRPTASNQTAEGRAKNRRIEIVIMPDLSDLPGAEEIEELFNRSQGQRES
jgi:chemotaxis protein MotB